MISTSKTRCSGSKITISSQTIVELSKSVLLPIQCDTMVPTNKESSSALKLAPCGQKISCWRAFHKHQSKHCGRKPSKIGAHHYVCRLSKCSAKLHTSPAALKSHIELSHLKHLPLPCPFTSCVPDVLDFGPTQHFITFSRSRDLVMHFEEEHADLIDRELDVSSELLLPRWEPCYPARPLPIPPPVPRSIPPGGIFLEPIAVKPTPHLTQVISASHTSLPVTHTPKPPRHRRMLGKPSIRDPSPANQQQSRFEFADLPDVEFNRETNTLSPPDILQAPNFAVQRIGKGLPQRKDLVRPLPMGQVPLIEKPPPPTSIFYDALRRQVYSEYALGQSAAVDS
ncbi:hypothetical protein C8R44DRAFT_766916 [Mycena epipterygia]|nr:hypothetical protein C8R44DRAFT_766916 [Mycena epipterygia]